MYPTDVFPQLVTRKLSPEGVFRALYGPTFCYCHAFSHWFLQSPCHKGIVVGPWRLALSVEQLIDDQPESGMAVLQACLLTRFYPSASRPPFCPPDWQGAGGREAGLLSSLAWTLCPSRLNE